MHFKTQEDEDRYWRIQWGINIADNDERNARQHQIDLIADQNEILAGLAQR